MDILQEYAWLFILVVFAATYWDELFFRNFLSCERKGIRRITGKTRCILSPASYNSEAKTNTGDKKSIGT
jgi:hypothetical protein